MAASSSASGSAKQVNRAEVVDQNFIAFVNSLKDRLPDQLDAGQDTAMSAQDLLELFDSQMQSRQMDLMARVKRLENKVFYTIGSSGHEGNALVGRLTRHTDPAFLHYRSGGFMAERSRKLPESDFIRDTALSFAASKNDPSSGGRHKVWGSRPLWVLPQTSTIASHLPKAVGTALAIAQAPGLKRPLPVPEDSIVVCSFGDASTNHSTAQGAFNAAQWAAYQGLPVPLLMVCEDNNIGISVRTPAGWVETNFRNRPGIHYIAADGLDLSAGFDAVWEAVNHCRQRRQPVFLHLRTTRLMGHAGTDFEVDYRSLQDLEAAEALDPLLRSAELVVAAGLMTPDEVLQRYDRCRWQCLEAADQADAEPRLETLEDVARPLAPLHLPLVSAEASRRPRAEARLAAFGSEKQLPERMGRRHLAILINWALTDLMAKYPETLLFGEDVAQKGGVYTITRGLMKRFGPRRVFNTLLDEQTILGLAQGYGAMGLLPLPEIQYLAYFHNACDQIRGEASSLQFFSNGQYRNPMLMRIASLGYQKGFGGHFHNDNSIAALRDIPGLVVGCPSRGDDAVLMLRTLAALAREDGRICAFLEPIALYMTKDLYMNGDSGWLFAYPEPGKAMPLGEGRVYFPEAEDLLIITFGNGVPMSLRAARAIQRAVGAKVRVLDLRWLQPLNHEQIVGQARLCRRVLVVDEGRRSAGVGEGVITALVEAGLGDKAIERVVGADCFTPLGDAAKLVLPAEEDIVAAAIRLCQRKQQPPAAPAADANPPTAAGTGERPASPPGDGHNTAPGDSKTAGSVAEQRFMQENLGKLAAVMGAGRQAISNALNALATPPAPGRDLPEPSAPGASTPEVSTPVADSIPSVQETGEPETQPLAPGQPSLVQHSDAPATIDDQVSEAGPAPEQSPVDVVQSAVASPGNEAVATEPVIAQPMAPAPADVAAEIPATAPTDAGMADEGMAATVAGLPASEPPATPLDLQDQARHAPADAGPASDEQFDKERVAPAVTDSESANAVVTVEPAAVEPTANEPQAVEPEAAEPEAIEQSPLTRAIHQAVQDEAEVSEAPTPAAEPADPATFTVDQSTVGQSLADQPAAGQPVIDQFEAEQLEVDQRLADQRSADQPAVTQSVEEQTADPQANDNHTVTDELVSTESFFAEAVVPDEVTVPESVVADKILVPGPAEVVMPEPEFGARVDTDGTDDTEAESTGAESTEADRADPGAGGADNAGEFQPEAQVQPQPEPQADNPPPPGPATETTVLVEDDVDDAVALSLAAWARANEARERETATDNASAGETGAEETSAAGDDTTPTALAAAESPRQRPVPSWITTMPPDLGPDDTGFSFSASVPDEDETPARATETDAGGDMIEDEAAVMIPETEEHRFDTLSRIAAPIGGDDSAANDHEGGDDPDSGHEASNAEAATAADSDAEWASAEQAPVSPDAQPDDKDEAEDTRH